MKGNLSELYVDSVLSIEDVTELSHQVSTAHKDRDRDLLGSLSLPLEQPYIPRCSPDVLVHLGMLPGQTAQALSQIGRGKAVAL